MNDIKLIMTINEFRQLTGEATAHLTDEEAIESIKQLDFMADMYVKQARKEVADKLEDKE
jgi:hypothetical protein